MHTQPSIILYYKACTYVDLPIFIPQLRILLFITNVIMRFLLGYVLLDQIDSTLYMNRGWSQHVHCSLLIVGFFHRLKPAATKCYYCNTVILSVTFLLVTILAPTKPPSTGHSGGGGA